MEAQIKQETREKMRRIRQSQKVYGIPVLPQKIDAMYENKHSGLFGAAHDPDPIKQDPVYLKLDRLCPSAVCQISVARAYERVAWQYQQDMRARQMSEKRYHHIRRMPPWLLKLEFLLNHERDKELRYRISEREKYMYRDENKEWTDE